ncbi:MAG: ArsR family transcriptional regulator [Thermoplasmatota archaeon]
MRKESTLVLDEHDEEIATLLGSLGLARASARALVFLCGVGEAISSEVEQGTGLRQPEVSLAMREMRRSGWVEKRDLRRKQKGRPVHCYRLLVALEDVFVAIEKEKRERAERESATLARLRALAARPHAEAQVPSRVRAHATRAH